MNDNADQGQTEMPRYKSHKEVHAHKIADIQHPARAENEESDGSMFIHPAEDGFGPFRVSREYMKKHKPQVGGYYVRYAGGYESWSPADAFEDGYTRVN